ncbi:MAG: hypothetical protein ACP5XB_22315 [Isosphaeraceae bacterium]
MIPQPPIPELVWDTVPPQAQDAILAVLDSLQGRITELEQRVGDLEALWTFVHHEGVEPTNNASERAPRHAVIWRRISGGTDKESRLISLGHFPHLAECQLETLREEFGER